MNPACHNDLFHLFEFGGVSSIEELAHIIGKKKKGPRGMANLPLNKRDEYDNIILLCPKCHSLIDKAESEFPAELLLSWKKRHEESLTNVFEVPIFDDRAAIAAEVRPLLRRNKAIFDEYGPFSEAEPNPLNPRAATWARLVRTDLVPNNRRILHCLLKNDRLLTDDERSVVEAFRLHAEALEYNHLSGDKTADAPLFPVVMNRVLES